MVIGKGVELEIAQGTALAMGSAMGEDKEKMANLCALRAFGASSRGFLPQPYLAGSNDWLRGSTHRSCATAPGRAA